MTTQTSPGSGDGTGGDPTVVVLPVASDIRAAEDVVAQCRAALDAVGDVHIHADAVERLDGAIGQCLIALIDGLRDVHREVTVVEPSEAFVRSVSLLGFAESVFGSSPVGG